MQFICCAAADSKDPASYCAALLLLRCMHKRAPDGAPAAVPAETTKLLWFKWETEGRMLYDALQQVEVVHRANGKGDRYVLLLATGSWHA
jgi:hypothetical protein